MRKNSSVSNSYSWTWQVTPDDYAMAGACCSDHSKGIRAAFRARFPGVARLGCWAHVSKDHKKGTWLSKKHWLYEFVGEVLHELHECCSAGMWNVLVECVAKHFSGRDRGLKEMWNSVLAAPHDDWYLGTTLLACATPMNNPQEV